MAHLGTVPATPSCISRLWPLNVWSRRSSVRRRATYRGLSRSPWLNDYCDRGPRRRNTPSVGTAAVLGSSRGHPCTRGNSTGFKFISCSDFASRRRLGRSGQVFAIFIAFGSYWSAGRYCISGQFGPYLHCGVRLSSRLVATRADENQFLPRRWSSFLRSSGRGGWFSEYSFRGDRSGHRTDVQTRTSGSNRNGRDLRYGSNLRPSCQDRAFRR